MKTSLRIIYTLALMLCNIASLAHGQDVDVYIITGQSNSLGTTGLEGGAPAYEPGIDPADAATRFFWSNVSASNSNYPPTLYGDSGGAITTLQMQQGDGGANPFFWGPEFGFARTIHQNTGGNEVLIIKVSRGGGGNSLWDETIFNSNNNSGHMWGHVRDQVDEALGLITTAGDTFDIKGLIFMQGESNSGSEAGVADMRIRDFANSLRSHINTNYGGAAPNMYTVIAEIAASGSNANRTTTTELQSTLAHHDLNFGFVTTADLPLKSDNIHFGRDAKLTYGRRIADAFNSRNWVEQASWIGGYNATPNLFSNIPDPAGQGMSFLGSVAGVTTGEIVDGGIRAWTLSDNSSASNPGYFLDLHANDFERMFNEGWQFTATGKVVSEGGLALWSLTQPNDPGWGVPATGNMNGFQLVRINGDELRVILWQNQSPIDLGAGSADAFHTFQMKGAAGSSLFDFYIDGQLSAAGLDLLDGAGLNSAIFEDTVFFNSGSTGGVGFEVNWAEISLLTELPVVVAADTVTITRGLLAAGGPAELADSDNIDLSIRRSLTDVQSRTEFVVKGLSPTEAPWSLEVTLEGAVISRSTVNQTIELFDYVAGDWEQIDARPAMRFTDLTVTVAAMGDLSRFVETGTQCIEARILYQSPIPRQQFASFTDQFVWTIGL